MSQDSILSWQRHLDTATRSTVEDGEPESSRVTALTVLGHPDSARVGERALLLEPQTPTTLPISRLEPLFSTPDQPKRRPLADPHLSRRPVLLASLEDGGYQIDLSQTRTQVLVEGRPARNGQRLGGEGLDRGWVLTLSNRVVLLLHRVELSVDPNDGPLGLVGESQAIRVVRRQIRRIAQHGVSVLIRGETGTGKELVARAIHHASHRHQGPFVALNMGAIPPTLAAAELFGATKGAFTGADRARRGVFRQADGGTLLLDEIGETPPEIQVLLLRALETGRIRPVGDEREHAVDVRILAATDAPLERAIDEERFRAPLLHRLGGYEIRLPALRERRDDIPRLLIHFLRQELDERGELGRLAAPIDTPSPWLPAELVTRLVLYSWPGNIRQLRNLVRQLLVGGDGESLRPTPEIDALFRQDEARATPRPAMLSDASGPASPGVGTADGPRVTPSDRPATPSDRPATPSDLAPPPTTEDGHGAGRKTYRSPHQVGDDELVAALRAHRFNILPTAKALGISRGSLYNLIDQCPRVRKAADLLVEEIERSRARHHGDLDAMAAELEVSRKGLSRRITELGL